VKKLLASSLFLLATLSIAGLNSAQANTVNFSGTFDSTGDKEIFKLHLPTASANNLFLAYYIGLDPILFLFDQTGQNLVAFNDDITDFDLSARIETLLPAGDYFLTLTRYSFYPTSIYSQFPDVLLETPESWSLDFTTDAQDATIKVVPLPSAIWLFGAALVMFALKRRRF
jgi:hypothetical protein